MKTDQLVYFLETAKTQHIGKAAKQLHISASAISHSIAALESELGQDLFENVGKNIYLTSKGKLLAERCQEILNLMEKVKEDFQNDDIEFTGKLRLACTHGLLYQWIIPTWSLFYRQHTKLAAEFYSLRSAQVVEQIAKGELDLGICLSPTESPLFISRTLKTESLQIAVRPFHPILKMQKNRRIALLSKLRCAAPKAFQGIEVCFDHPALKKIGVESNAVFIFDSYDAAAKMVADSDIWALMPECFIRWYGLKILNVPGFIAHTTINVLYPKGRSLSKMARKFIEMLDSSFNSLKGA